MLSDRPGSRLSLSPRYRRIIPPFTFSGFLCALMCTSYVASMGIELTPGSPGRQEPRSSPRHRRSDDGSLRNDDASHRHGLTGPVTGSHQSSRLAGTQDRPSVATPGRSGRYRVIAMAMGSVPTVIGVPAVPVAVRIGVTVPEPIFRT
jgi:hypothetical protein